MNLFGWCKAKRISLPDESKDGNQAEQKLKESEQKLKEAIKTRKEVQIARDQFARSIERAMRRSHG